MQKNRLTKCLIYFCLFFVGTSEAFSESFRLVEFQLPVSGGSTHEIVPGPDGNLWITQQKAGRIIRLSTSGETAEFDVGDTGPHGLQFDANGMLWVTLEFSDELIQLGLDGKIEQRFRIPHQGAGPHGLSIARNGDIWWTGKAANVIGKLDPTTGKMLIYPLGSDMAKPIYISPGPGGDMWFTELEGSRIGKISPDGSMDRFDIPSTNVRPIVIFRGPNERMFYTEERGNAYGTITKSGTFERFRTNVENGLVAGAAFDNNGNLWLQFNRPDIIQRISSSGDILTISIPTKNAVQHRIVLGPDNNMWFTQLASDKVGKIIITD